MLDLAQVLFGGLFPLAAAWSAGRAVSRRGPELSWPIVFGLGSALLSLALFFLHVSGAVRPWTLLALGAAAIAAGWEKPAIPRPSREWLAAVPFLALYAVHALAPEIQPDAITYHLGLVAEWNREGGFAPRAGFYEVLPQGLEMLFSMAFAFGGHSSAKIVHLAFVAATAALIADAARGWRCANGVPAALIYACAPVVAVAGTSAYNDAALAFAFAAAFLTWERSPAAAGALAGFAYAVKLPGILAAPAVIAFLAVRRRWKDAVLAGCAAAAIGAPWMLRAVWMTGNPLAPLYNRWFENPHFHPSTEAATSAFVRTYGATPAELPLEVTVRGARTAGLAGPVFLLAPLSLLALRRREGRWLLAGAAVAFVPWWFNAGTRFLMPALALLSLAMVLLLPRPVAWLLAAAQMLSAWPHVLEQWTPPGSWHLRGIPYRAAFRLEDESAYLKRTLWEYRLAEMIREHTGREHRVLDLNISPPAAYLETPVVTWWQSAPADRAVDALRIAALALPDSYWQAAAKWEPQPLRAVRAVLAGPGAGGAPWSVQEMDLLRAGAPLFPSGSWDLEAAPNPWESHLAFDRNPVSRWQSWSTAAAGMWIAARFPSPLPLDGVRLTVFQPPARAVLTIEGLHPARDEWFRLAEPHWSPLPALNFRKRAASFVKREGFSHILTRAGAEGLSSIGMDILNAPGDWNLQLIAETDGVYLFRLK